MRAFSMARVSSPEQLRNASIQTQLEANVRYAARHGLNVVAEFVDDFTGATLDRPGISEMLRRVRLGDVRHIIVYTLDRLTREPADFLPLRKELHTLGVTIHIAREDRAVADDPIDQLPDDIKVIIAKHERAVFRERSMRGVAAKVRSGRPVGGGPPPYGYTWEGYKRTRTLVICEAEAAVVRSIFTWYVLGDGQGPLNVSQIAQRLAEQQIPTRADTTGRPKTRGYAQWSTGSLRAILRNAIYSGQGFALRKQVTSIGSGRSVKRDEADWLPISAPQIISEALATMARQRLAIGKEQSQRATRHPYLLRCRLRCACGYSLAGTSSSGGTRRCYRCLSRDSARGRSPCDLPLISCAALDTVVWAWLTGEVLHPEHLAQALERRQAQRSVAHTASAEQRATDAARLIEIERQIARLLDLYLGGQFERVVLDKRHADLVTEQQRLKAAIAAQAPAQALTRTAVQSYVDFAAVIAAGLEDMTPAEQRRVVELLDVRITMRQTGSETLADVRAGLRREAVTLAVASTSSSCFQSNLPERIEFAATLQIPVRQP